MKRFLAFLCSGLLAGSLVAPPAAAATAGGVRLKLSFGWCKTACEIRIKVTNNSRYNIDWVGGTCRLRVNGRFVGKGTIYIGPIKRGHSRSSTCNVVDSRLEDAWWDYENGDAVFSTYATAKGVYHYRYRR
ncbi:hypothetical protein AB0B45_22935 [Nonomuraea sp. NPDC049152]|uniref:hypothetical protein n=1 Tax=Nonomuraea sp. NPDC049152 TaxID=3154350 RepID=UPI003406AC8A